MKTQCAWCGALLRDGDGPVSHGICVPCRQVFERENGVSLRSFIDKFPVPILVVNGNFEPVTVNKCTEESSRFDLSEAAMFSFGSIVECDRAHLPEGCGRTVHCSGCVLRLAIKTTHETGAPMLRVPATLTVGASEVSFYISTVQVDGSVVVKLDKATVE